MAFFLRREDIEKMLSGEAVTGKRLLEPLKTLSQKEGVPLNILEDHEVSNEAEVHTEEGDLWECLRGEVVFTVGGELAEPRCKKNPDGSDDCRELKSPEINGEKDIVLKKGDWLWIPPGEPHKHRTRNTARLAIIKIPARRPH